MSRAVSNEPWLGKMPSDWQHSRIRNVAELSPNYSARVPPPDEPCTVVPMELLSADGTIDVTNQQPLMDISTGLTLFEPGDVLFAKITPCMENGKGALVRRLPTRYAFGSTEFHVLRPSKKVDGQFLYYATLNPVFRAYAAENMVGAAGQKRVSSRFVKDTRFFLPPLPEQRRIAAYLDVSCAAIDAAIDAKRRQLETLDALRKSIIHRAVTMGLNPDVTMEPARIGWLSEIPAHWCVDRIRDRLGRIVGGEWGDDPDAHDEGIELPVIRVADIRGIDLTVEGLTVRRIRETKLSGRLIGRRTILIEKSGGGEQTPVGRAVRTRLIDFDAICSNFMAKVDCGDTVSPDFVVYLLDALYSCGVNTSCIQQTTGIQNLRVTDYLNTKVGIPPLPEQERIVAYLDAKYRDITSLEKMLETQITTLTTYRKSLIHECVTGHRRITESDLSQVNAHG